ncbi:MAG: glycosyltransferase family 2 protein [Ktedonobacteraceae bacterium]|nr:glycosyltransferase family 2 protein [Ktedonobacteraceae bacterium]MBO0794830.1 glycosyltransferase family 2 protein [Ktedonobacteraceae bacterium]
MKRTTCLSIIVPLYNEAESVALLHERLYGVLQEQERSFEIIYVDDGSTDGTIDQLRTLVEQGQHTRAIQLRRNFGQTAAIAAGVDASRGETLIFMDGDLQNDPVDIPHLLAKLDEGYDVVSGWRKKRRDAPISRKLPSLLANRLISYVTGVHLHDYGCTLKAFRWEVFQHMRLYGEMHRFLPAYAALVGASIAEIEVAHHPRRFGVSKYGISRTVRVILDMLTVKFMGRYATRPLHAFGLTGLLMLILALGIMVTALTRAAFSRSSASMGAASSNALLLLGLTLQCLMSGLSAEMLTRIYYESQRKPVYTIKAVFPALARAEGEEEAA